MRVVADTNVYISALNFGGTAEEVLALARAGVIELVTSRPILREVEDVLVRKFLWSRVSARSAIAAIRQFASVRRPRARLDIVKHDDPDNRILECAAATKADVIISGDRDLLSLGRFGDTVILRPGEFLRIVSPRP